MDNLFHTITFTAVAGFFQSLWAEINGRIFLTTFIAYAVSYMIYSGYMSWFAGGYGGLLLTQVGFSVIDLLGLIPMAFVLLVESLWPLVKSAGKFILLYIVLPFVLLNATAFFLVASNLRLFPGNAALEATGFLLWGLGLSIGMFAQQLEEHSWVYWLSLAMCYLGMALAGLTAPFASISALKATTASFQTTQNLITNITFEALAAMLLVILPMIPLWVGQSMAAHAAKRKLLSRVQKLFLKQAIEIPGALPVEKTSKKKKASNEEKDRPIYLVASLSKTTALYIPPETNSTEKGSLVLLANDLICAMEI